MNASDIGLICDAVTKLGVAGKQVFFVFMAVKAFETMVTGSVIIYALTIILSTIRKGIASSSFCTGLSRIVNRKYLSDGSLNEDAKKEITKFAVENMSPEKKI